MPWVEFSQRFDWKPKPTVTVVYKPGMRLLVTTPCANAAVVAGKARRVRTPNRDEAKEWQRAGSVTSG